MAIICIEGLPGKIGRCINTDPPHVPGGIGKPKPKTRVEETGAYPDFFVDTSIIDSIHQSTKIISDSGARAALQAGIEAAVKALIKRAGDEGISIALTD
jgi:hypothetical protein